ncbi:MAG: hypothetical protein U1E36_07835 [Rickettsiales bacterium]
MDTNSSIKSHLNEAAIVAALVLSSVGLSYGMRQPEVETKYELLAAACKNGTITIKFNDLEFDPPYTVSALIKGLEGSRRPVIIGDFSGKRDDGSIFAESFRVQRKGLLDTLHGYDQYYKTIAVTGADGQKISSEDPTAFDERGRVILEKLLRDISCPTPKGTAFAERIVTDASWRER